MVGQMLLEMDGIEALDDVVVLAATSRPDLIDPALLRPGRFDLVVDLPLPDEASRLAILQVQCGRLRIDSGVPLPKIAAATGGMSGADLEALCRGAVMQAISESMRQDPGPQFRPFDTQARHFEAALAALAPGARSPQAAGRDPGTRADLTAGVSLG
jgi:transitional endoplasmic reticulum ATPase